MRRIKEATTPSTDVVFIDGHGTTSCREIGSCIALTKSLSENTGGTQCGDGELKMQEAQIIRETRRRLGGDAGRGRWRRVAAGAPPGPQRPARGKRPQRGASGATTGPQGATAEVPPVLLGSPSAVEDELPTVHLPEMGVRPMLLHLPKQ
jgi:hypothetical protein